ncbi:MAG: hypothetical protein K6A65_03860 [Succinivibrionaceae bacterium]|nr:hypothetical protein [Succinivibrionaceae bacterium]
MIPCNPKKSLLWMGLALSLALGGCAGGANAPSSAAYGNAQGFLLDPVAQAGIHETNQSVNLPTALLVPVEGVTAEGVASAKKQVELAAAGVAGKSGPISVVKRGDGNFTVLDGSRMFTYLKQQGAKSVPVVVSYPYTKGADTIEELLAMNEAARAEFTAKVKEIQQAVGGEILLRTKPKELSRIKEKIKDNYAGNVGGVTDILAGRLLMDDAKGILAALDYIKGRDDIVAFEDRWNVPLESGYRDVVSYLYMKNGVVGELQFSHRDIIALDGIDHKLYEFIRSHGGREYQQINRRIIIAKKRLIGLAADGQAAQIDVVREQLGEVCGKIAKAKDAKAVEPLVAQLEALVAKIK